MKKIIIAAKSRNNVIGKGNDLAWHLPADLKFFKEKTKGHYVIMGRKTFESIGSKPLPQRPTIIITNNPDFKAENCWVINSINGAFEIAKNEKQDDVFILGGAHIYKQTIDLADQMFITEIHTQITGDSYFPEINEDRWVEVSREEHKADEKNKFDFAFVEYKSIR